jgi:hypothetical protein
MGIKYTNIFQSKALQNLSKIGILVLKTYHLATLIPNPRRYHLTTASLFLLNTPITSPQVGTIVHPMGNIAEALLKEGLAKVVDWSLACVSTGPEKYRQVAI